MKPKTQQSSKSNQSKILTTEFKTLSKKPQIDMKVIPKRLDIKLLKHFFNYR